MPTLQQLYYLDITPEKFIDNCSDVELHEVLLLANARLNRMERTSSPPRRQPKPQSKELPKVAPKKALPKASISSTVPAAKGRKWTSEEDAMLGKLWSEMSGKKIAEKLNREYKTVMLHASRIGLRKNNKRSPKTTDEPEEPEEPTSPSPAKKLISVRVDKRTIVQVPAGTDVEKIKNKYGNK